MSGAPFSSLAAMETDRLYVRLANEEDVDAIVRFNVENREFLQPFEPLRPAGFYEERFWRSQVRQNAAELQADRALRLFLFPKSDPDRVIGTANYTNIQRGVGQMCTLGYSLAEEWQGKGIMFEALEASLRYVFGALNLHRVQASYMPHNRRSGRLLRRLGFVVEGYARDYILIAGRWEDHVLTSLSNPGWEERPTS